MGDKSTIEWTEATWNPVAGCSVISPGCTNCYAMRMARRLEAMGQDKYMGTTRLSGGRPKWNGKVNCDEFALKIPSNWKKGRMIFVNSMSDLFHDKVPSDFIMKVFKIMNTNVHHTFQILTKRASRLEKLSPKIQWSNNIWTGVSVENSDYSFRIDHLRNTNAQVKFISLEPLLGPMNNLDLGDIDWVIVGGESGPSARPVERDWVCSIRDQCESTKTAFHFKQWGGTNKKKTGRILDGVT